MATAVVFAVVRIVTTVWRHPFHCHPTSSFVGLRVDDSDKPMQNVCFCTCLVLFPHILCCRAINRPLFRADPRPSCDAMRIHTVRTSRYSIFGTPLCAASILLPLNILFNKPERRQRLRWSRAKHVGCGAEQRVISHSILAITPRRLSARIAGHNSSNSGHGASRRCRLRASHYRRTG